MEHNNVDIYPVLSGGRMIVVKVKEMLSGIAREADRQRGNVTNFYITGGGDIIGRDKSISAGDHSTVVGGEVSNSDIVTGDDNEVKK
jgi:hypothetical protein